MGYTYFYFLGRETITKEDEKILERYGATFEGAGQLTTPEGTKTGLIYQSNQNIPKDDWGMLKIIALWSKFPEPATQRP